MCFEGKARLIDVMWGVRKTVKHGYKVIGLRIQKENLWEEQIGKELDFGHVFATNMRHPRRDEDLALEFREKVLARDTSSGVDGTGRMYTLEIG